MQNLIWTSVSLKPVAVGAAYGECAVRVAVVSERADVSVSVRAYLIIWLHKYAVSRGLGRSTEAVVLPCRVSLGFGLAAVV